MINITTTPTETAITAAGYLILSVQPIDVCVTASLSELMDVRLTVEPTQEWTKHIYLSILNEFPPFPQHYKGCLKIAKIPKSCYLKFFDIYI